MDHDRFWRNIGKAWTWCEKNGKEHVFWHAFEHYLKVDRRNMSLPKIGAAMPNAVITWTFPDDLSNGGVGYETKNYIAGLSARVQALEVEG